MKKLGFLLMVMALVNANVAHSQNQKSEQYRLAETNQVEGVSKVYIQLIVEDDLNTSDIKIHAILGKDNQFYIKDKRDFEIYDALQGEIKEFTMLPDALNYLGEKGFEIESFTSVFANGRIRHNVILSRSTKK